MARAFFPRMVDVVPSLRGLQRAAKIYRRSLLLMHHRTEAVVQTSFSSERISLKFTIIQHLIATSFIYNNRQYCTLIWLSGHPAERRR